MLLNIYMNLLEVIQKFGLKVHQHADGIQLYLFPTDSLWTSKRVVGGYFGLDKNSNLKVNPDKAEVVVREPASLCRGAHLVLHRTG